MSIRQKVLNLSTLDDDILAKLDSVLDRAASMMEQFLGSDNYTVYLSLPSDDKDNPHESGYIPYSNLDASGRNKRKLEEAEAHFALANLIFAGKKRFDEDILLDTEEFGKGSFVPAGMDELQKLYNYHISEAKNIISGYLETISEGSIGNASIRFYVLAKEAEND